MKGEYELPKHDSFGGASMCVKKSWGWVVNSFPCLGSTLCQAHTNHANTFRIYSTPQSRLKQSYFTAVKVKVLGTQSCLTLQPCGL